MAAIVASMFSFSSKKIGSPTPTACERWTRPVILAQQPGRVLEGDEVITLNDLQIRDTVSIPVAPLASFHRGRL